MAKQIIFLGVAFLLLFASCAPTQKQNPSKTESVTTVSSEEPKSTYPCANLTQECYNACRKSNGDAKLLTNEEMECIRGCEEIRAECMEKQMD